MWGLIHALTHCFSTVNCLLLLYFILFTSKLEYALPAWNITTTNANKLECAKWKFAALSCHFFLIFLTVMLLHLSCCSCILYKWQDVTLMPFFFIIHVSPRSKFYTSVVDNSSLRVPSCNTRNFTQFSAGHKNCPSTRCCKFGMQWYRYRYRYIE